MRGRGRIVEEDDHPAASRQRAEQRCLLVRGDWDALRCNPKRSEEAVQDLAWPRRVRPVPAQIRGQDTVRVAVARTVQPVRRQRRLTHAARSDDDDHCEPPRAIRLKGKPIQNG